MKCKIMTRILIVICLLPVIVLSTSSKFLEEWKWPWQTFHPTSFPTSAPTSSPPTSAPSTSFPTYLPRYSSMISMTIDGMTRADMENQTVLGRSVKMAVATIFDTTLDDIDDLTIVNSEYNEMTMITTVDNGYSDDNDNLRSSFLSSPTFSPTDSSRSTSSPYYVSNTYDGYDGYDDYDDYKYDDGYDDYNEYESNAKCKSGNKCVTITTNVKSIYNLNIFTELMINRSDTFMELFSLYAYNYNFTYGNYTGLWATSISNTSTTSTSSNTVNISSCLLIRTASNTVSPTTSPTYAPTSHPTTPAPTCQSDTFQFLDIDYTRVETISVVVASDDNDDNDNNNNDDNNDDNNVRIYNITTKEKYLHFFLLGDWGKGGNDGDITGEATSEPSIAPTSNPTTTTASSSSTSSSKYLHRRRRHHRLKDFKTEQPQRQRRRRNRRLEGPEGGEGGEGRDENNEGGYENAEEGEEGNEGREGDEPDHDGEEHEHEDEEHEDEEHEDEEHEHEDEEREHERDPRSDHDDKTYQAAIAKQMSVLASEMSMKFVVALGDNFYDDGVQSTSDTQWNTSWYDVYMKRFSNLAMPFYAVLGNHDYGYGDEGVQAQIDKTYDFETNGMHLWNMPAQAYAQLAPLPDGGSILMIHVDTTTLNPSANECCNEDGGVSTSEQAYRISHQLNTIATAIDCAMKDAAEPSWVIVSGHYPVYSTGEHADSDELIENLVPLFEEYNVDIYFSGHDHIAEHLQYDDVDYFIAGGGALTGEEGEESIADVQWVGAGYSSIAVASVTKDNFTVSYYNVDNDLVYRYTKVKVEEVETSSPSSYPSTTPTVYENNDNSGSSFSNFETALYTFYASCSALGAFAFVFLFSNAYNKIVGMKTAKETYVDLQSVDKYLKNSCDDDDDDFDDRREKGFNDLSAIEMQSYSMSSPAPPPHSAHIPHSPSAHPYASWKQSPTSPNKVNISNRYLSTTSTHHSHQNYLHDHREQERLRNMGFTVIP